MINKIYLLKLPNKSPVVNVSKSQKDFSLWSMQASDYDARVSFLYDPVHFDAKSAQILIRKKLL